MAKALQEVDLYPPVKEYLENLGYRVQAEVRDCDVVAEKDGTLLVCELKRTFSLELVLQGARRQRMADIVYLAVPAKAPGYVRKMHDVFHLLRRLELGLLSVDLKARPPQVKELVAPRPYDPRGIRTAGKRERNAVLKEFHARPVDLNRGGSTGEKLYTAYKLDALAVAEHLHANGPCRACEVAAATGIGRAHPILYRNPMGWFVRRGQGIYDLSDRGREALAEYHLRLLPPPEEDGRTDEDW